jgi:hypothetical protein
MADEFNKEIKSNRLLQSLRYTAAAQDNQEAFTKVLDLNASEVYTQQQYVPTSSLPYSGSSQHLQYVTATIDGSETNIAQYYFELTCSRSSRNFGSSKSEIWFTISGSGYDPVATNSGAGIGSTIIEPLQQTNWLSNKYASASLALNTAEDSTPGYNVLVKIDGSNVNSQNYQFDYKTGVLQFVSNAVSPSETAIVTVTGYRYVAKTLADETFGSGGSGAGFPFSGSAVITGSLLVSGSDVNFSNATSISLSTFTAESASIDHLVVNTLISGSTIVTSGSNTFGDETSDVQTLIGTTKMTGSAQVTGSLNVDGVFTLPGISNVSQSIANAVAGGGIFNEIGSTDIYNTDKSLQITGSTLQSTPLEHSTNLTSSDGSSKYAMVVSQSVWHRNANVGVPTSNAWKSDLGGSYFNTFDHNTDISEILRFMAGLLSSSAPSSAPNTKTYDSITATPGGTQTGAAPAGYVPQNAADPTVVYLKSKGFASDGNSLFNGISTIYDYNGSAVYKRNYSSVFGGSTNVSSSTDAQLFGLGTIGLAFAVSGTLNWSFSSGSNKAVTLTSQSENLLTRTGAGTSDGLTIGNIQTANPAVIPNEFQDGKFANIFEAEISDISSGIDFQTTESVGYYQLSSSIKIRTGSAAANFSSEKTDKAEIFYAPVDELNNNINSDSAQSFTLSLPYSASLLVTSRSLSGAPYMRTANWEISNSIAGVFNPLYPGNTSNVARMHESGDSDSIIAISAGGSGNITLSIGSDGEIDTTGVVFNNSGTVRNSGVPAVDDTIRLSGSIALTAGAGGATNIVQNNGTDNNLDDLDFNILTKNKNRSGTESTRRTDNFQYFVDGTFGQPAASGSMGYYGRAQGYDGGSATGTSENFSGEDFRKQINNNLLSVTSTDAYGTTYSDGLVSPTLDLQVKPGFLVKPGGTYKYWLPTSGTEDYRYYARLFDTGGGTFSSMTIDIGKTLVNWTDTAGSDTVAVGILYESGASGNILIDVADVTGGNTGTTTPTTGLNPFGVNIDIKSNNQSSAPSGTNYNISTNAGKSITLNATNNLFVVLIRYKGDPAPVTSITTAYQA